MKLVLHVYLLYYMSTICFLICLQACLTLTHQRDLLVRPAQAAEAGKKIRCKNLFIQIFMQKYFLVVKL